MHAVKIYCERNAMHIQFKKYVFCITWRRCLFLCYEYNRTNRKFNPLRKQKNDFSINANLLNLQKRFMKHIKYIIFSHVLHDDAGNSYDAHIINRLIKIRIFYEQKFMQHAGEQITKKKVFDIAPLNIFVL